MAKGRNYAKEVRHQDFTAMKKGGHIRTQPNRHKVETAKPMIAKKDKK